MSSSARRWAMTLGMALAITAARAQAQNGAWRPSPQPIPSATIGRPMAVDEYGSGSLPAPSSNNDFQPLSRADAIPVLSGPEAAILRTEASEPPPVPPPGLPPGAPPPGYTIDPTVRIDEPIGHGGGPGFWDKMGAWTGKANHFQSDHCFDEMISPVSNPFYFEDPRSLTEVRPIFFIQHAPDSNPIFHGGNSEFIGLQARLALTDCFSIVMNEFGIVSLHPDDPMDGINRETGLSQINIGPKWTFYRNQNTGTVAATGLTVEIPTSSVAYQNTGTVGLDPYITVAQNFGRLPQGWGSFNFMGEVGYSFGTDDERTDFLHTSLHLDYDVANLHRFYPLIELSWFHTTRRGDERDLTFEGTDLVNFGSRDVTDRDLVTFDVGARYKFREWLQFGTAFEVPLTDRKDLSDFRWTFDVIFRY